MRSNNICRRGQRLLLLPAVLAACGAWTALGWSQQATGPVKVVVKDGKTTTVEAALPVDPAVRLRIGHIQGALNFGLSVDGKRLCCGPDSSMWLTARIDGQMIQPGDNGMAAPAQALKAGTAGQKRQGFIWTWSHGNLHGTQTVELVPSKPSTGKPAAGEKRRLDTGRISYLVENKDSRAHKVELRQNIDIMINNNDGALFASPSTHPGKVLNGVELRDKALPEFLQVLERPDANNPGFMGVMSFRMGGKVVSPHRVVMTTLGSLGAGWDVPANMAGDTGAAIYWPPVDIQPGAKVEFAWAYGGGIAGSPENDGRVSIDLGGSFEPGKLFTIAAFVDDPLPNQTLTLELPDGMERVEGRAVQPVAPAADSGASVVLWKARVLRTGDFVLTIRSSSGVTQTKEISISR